MNKVIDYYLSLRSPWTYLGHQRFIDIAERHGAKINLWPMDFSIVFPATGGLPLPKRSPERRAYRMMELKRWRDYLGIPLTLEPKYFATADEKPAATVVIASRGERPDDALRFAGAVLRGLWAEEADIGDPETLAALAAEAGLDRAVLAEADKPEHRETLARDSRAAIDRGVFGAPSYLYNDELFWGQDRLDFLDRALAR